VIEEGDTHVPSELVFDEGCVRIGEKQHEEDEDEDSHALVRYHLPYIISLQYQGTLQLETHKLAPEDASQTTKQLTTEVDTHAFPLVFVFLFEAIRQSDHWVEIRSTKGCRQADGDQDGSCCLSVDLVGYHGTAKSEREDKHGYKLEGKELERRSIVHDAVHRVVKVTVDASFESLG
jgi:hypothetical protein